MASEEDTVRDYIRSFNDSNFEIYIEELEALPFLFEYACQTLESERHSPREYASQIPQIMIVKLESIIEKYNMNSWDLKGKRKVKFPNQNIIPFLVDRDSAQPPQLLKQNESSNRNHI